MRKTFLIVLAAACVLMATGVVVYHVGLGLSWVDSLYFVITTMTTVGYGDIHLGDASTPLKLFGNFLMLGGVALWASLLGLTTDYLVRHNLYEMLGRRRTRMKDHIVVCGVGNVGLRVLEQLLALGEPVVAVEKQADSRTVEMARGLKVPVVQGSIRVSSVLDEAGIREAKCVVAVSNDDLANLEAALHARAVNPDIRVVLRVFDANLAAKLDSGFGIHTAFSTSALAAPGFAMAAVDPCVVGSFYVDDEMMINLELTVSEGSKLDGLNTETLRAEGGLSVLSHCRARTAERRLHPAQPIELEAGDRLVVSVVRNEYRRIKELNQP